MRAYQIPKGGAGIESVVEVERPQPKPGHRQLLVKVKACSLNFRDLGIVRGTYRVPVRENVIPLSDGAGEVVEIGPGMLRVKVGDGVAGNFFQRWPGGESSAEVHGSAVRGLVVVNPSLAADNKLLTVAPVLKYVLKSVPGIASDIKKPGVKEVGYDKVPVAAAASLPGLWGITTKHLNEVTQPVLVYRSAVDHVVGPASMRVLLAGVPEALVTVRELADSYHVATLDNDAEAIFEGSLKFVQDHAG